MKRKLLSIIFVLTLTFVTLALTACGEDPDNPQNPTGGEAGHTHSLVYHPDVDATCTTKGNVAYYSCSTCSKNFSNSTGTTELANIVIPATGHSMTHHNAVPVACITDGKLEYWSCSGCSKNFTDADGKFESSNLTVEKNGIHNYGNDNKCINCEKDNPALNLGYKQKDNEYTIVGFGTVTDSDIVIPSTYNGLPVTSIGASAFAYYTSLVSITIPNSVTSIGSSAFTGCTKLESITIPNSVTSIGSSAFAGCTSLESIALPYVGATKDGTENTHFGYIFGAASYEDNNSYVPSSLKSVVITDGSIIGENAFAGCRSLLSITIPESVTSIGSNAFNGCYKLVEVYNKSSLDIEKGSADNGYIGCYAINILTDMTIPSKIDCRDDGYIFCLDEDTVYLVGYNGDDTELTLLKNYNGEKYEIKEYAFYNCTIVTSITIPEGVTTIGYYAFADCTSLESISVANSIINIGSSAFAGCTNLESITLPYVGVTKDGTENTHFGYIFGATSYEENGIYVPSSLKSVVITGGSSISSSAFAGCTTLESLTLPFAGAAKDGIENTHFGYIFGAASYEDNNSYVPSSLKSVVITGGSSIGENAFAGCTSLSNVTIGGSIISVGGYAFSNCTSLESVTILDSVKSIGIYAFYKCENLRSAVIGKSVTSIDSSAFSDCYTLVEVYNKSSLKITEGSSDNGCIGYFAINVFTDISVPSKIYYKDDGYIFYADGATVYLMGYIGDDTVLTLPESYNGKEYEINKYAFYNCTNITSIIIPDGVTNIGSYAFYGCEALENIIIPDSVSNIGSYAFYGCETLKNITIPDSVVSIDHYVFSGCTSLESLTIPESVVSIGKGVFTDCISLTSITFADTSTWYNTQYTEDWNNKTNGTQTSVTDTATNATNFTSTYLNYNWYKE